MLSQEQTFFLSVLADHLNGRPTAPVSELDWKIIHDMTERHQLSALFYAQCGAFLPPDAELRFLPDYCAAVTIYAARQQIAAEIEQAFTRYQIPYVIFKGLVVAESYPVPELRTMGDIDIIVKPEDKERAGAVLLALGFHGGEKVAWEWGYEKDSCKIELHHSLLYDEPGNTLSAKLFAERMWEYVRPMPESSRCEPDCNFHFLYLVIHLKKHLVHRGAGFRQFMDLAVAAQKWQLNRSQTEKWLAETELLSFAKFGLALGKKWFQLPLPFADSELEPEFELRITQQIFNNGVFGFDDEANEDNCMMAKMEADGGDCLSLRLRMCRKYFSPASPELKQLSFFYFWRILFPGYDYMRKLENYRFIDGRPWLLPAGWIWRMLCGGKYKIQHIFLIMMFSRKRVRERRQTLKKMGL